MNISYFDRGSFVVHGITGNFKGQCSAWFDKDGLLYSAQQIINYYTTRNVKIDGPIWQHLQKVGKRFVGLNKA